MAITGGVKFFDKNQNLKKDGATASATSGDDAAQYMLDLSQFTRWESVGSNDLTTETITVNLPQTTTIDRLLLVKHNLKDYDIKYNAAVEFTTVVGLDGALGGGITETLFADDTAYYEFDAVAVSSITITARKTQVADAEKYIGQVNTTTELGTLAGFPRVTNVSHNRNIKASRLIGGKRKIQKSYENVTFRLRFKTYPVQLDVDLMEDLHEKETSFQVWLCGGRRGTDYFTVEQRGWRLRDLYNMQLSRPLGTNYEKGIYKNGINSTVNFVEVV